MRDVPESEAQKNREPGSWLPTQNTYRLEMVPNTVKRNIPGSANVYFMRSSSSVLLFSSSLSAGCFSSAATAHTTRTPNQEQTVPAMPIATVVSEMAIIFKGGELGTGGELGLTGVSGAPGGAGGDGVLSKCPLTAGLQIVVMISAKIQHRRWSKKQRRATHGFSFVFPL